MSIHPPVMLTAPRHTHNSVQNERAKWRKWVHLVSSSVCLHYRYSSQLKDMKRNRDRCATQLKEALEMRRLPEEERADEEGTMIDSDS